MAAKRPTSEPADVTPTEADAGEATPVAVAADPTPAAPDSSSASASADPAVAETPAEAATPAQQVVYVEAPKPFVPKSNRVFGVLIALLSTVIFAVAYAVAGVVAELINHSPSVDFSFMGTLDFYAPVLMFAVGFVLLVLIVNRAGWAAHVIGSVLVGLVVFFGGTGVLLLLHINQIPSNQIGETFTRVIFSSESIVAALLGREVALWMGFSIAARGRKVKARNADARVLYDQEIAAKRAEYEQANARPAASAPAVDEPATASPTAP